MSTSISSLGVVEAQSVDQTILVVDKPIAKLFGQVSTVIEKIGGKVLKAMRILEAPRHWWQEEDIEEEEKV